MKSNLLFLAMMFIFSLTNFHGFSQEVDTNKELENIKRQLRNIKTINQNDHQKLSGWLESNKDLINSNRSAIDSLNARGLDKLDRLKATTDSLVQLNNTLLARQEQQDNDLHNLKITLILSGTVILITFILFLIIVIGYLRRVENNLAELLSVHGELSLEKFEELNGNFKKRTKETQDIIHDAFNKTHKQVKKIRKKK